MKYFHKAVSLYMKAYKDKESEETLERLAEDVLSQVEDTLFPNKQAIEVISKFIPLQLDVSALLKAQKLTVVALLVVCNSRAINQFLNGTKILVI